MTENAKSQSAESENNSNSPIPYVSKPLTHRINRWVQSRFNRKPAYRITKHGIEVEYLDFTDTEKLPFDLETYRETQLFIGSYANPWRVDIDSIEEAYPDFTEQKISNIQDVFAKRHVYPSQRWKLLANQNALRDMFVGGAIDDQRILRLLYLAIVGIGFIAILLLFGGS